MSVTVSGKAPSDCSGFLIWVTPEQEIPKGAYAQPAVKASAHPGPDGSYSYTFSTQGFKPGRYEVRVTDCLTPIFTEWLTVR